VANVEVKVFPIEALRDARWLLKMLGDRYTQIVNGDLSYSHSQE